MEIDYSILRNILKAVATGKHMSIEPNDPSILRYHIDILNQSGFFLKSSSIDQSTFDSADLSLDNLKLSLLGQEYWAALHDDRLWNLLLEVSAKIGSATFSTLKAVADQMIADYYQIEISNINAKIRGSISDQ